MEGKEPVQAAPSLKPKAMDLVWHASGGLMASWSNVVGNGNALSCRRVPPAEGV